MLRRCFSHSKISVNEVTFSLNSFQARCLTSFKRVKTGETIKYWLLENLRCFRNICNVILIISELLQNMPLLLIAIFKVQTSKLKILIMSSLSCCIYKSTTWFYFVYLLCIKRSVYQLSCCILFEFYFPLIEQ